MQWIASLVYTTLLFAWVLLFAIFFNIASLFVPLRTRYVLARHWANVILGGLKVICRLDYRIEGRENLPPGGHVALWKHSSSWETFAMVTVCPPQFWVLKRELLWIPFVGWGIRQMQSISIDRGRGRSPRIAWLRLAVAPLVKQVTPAPSSSPTAARAWA